MPSAQHVDKVCPLAEMLNRTEGGSRLAGGIRWSAAESFPQPLRASPQFVCGVEPVLVRRSLWTASGLP